ncbi:MAG TPA: hypothetical protein PKE66_08495, partial [Pyrinomonadaceae bacterium]|nr:hypothetical protein [Pyrinomonadaceae bacterium]
MKFDNGIDRKYRRSVEEALEVIAERGTDEQKVIVRHILGSEMAVRVKPVAAINASGITGLIDPAATN